MKKKHLVLVTTWFPPTNGVAVNRMDAFVKYFDKSKMDVSVITLKKDVASLSFEKMYDADVYRLSNNSFFKLAEFNKGHSRLTHIAKVAWNYFVRTLIKHPLAKWMKGVNQQLELLHKEHPIDVVITSSSPVECHWAVKAFLQKYNSVNWVADARDELSLNPHLDEVLKSDCQQLEQFINKRANILTTVSKPIADDFSRLCPAIKVYEIRNGHQLNLPSIADYKFNKIFTIVYAGTFYGARKPDNFFKGLEQFIARGENIKNVQIRFVGTPKNFNYSFDKNIQIEFVEQCSYGEACKFQMDADANLLILPKLEAKGVYSGKLFDYLAACKPIIAVVDTTDVAAKLINDCNAGYVADFDNVNDIEAAIEAAYQHWQSKTMLNCNRTKIEQLHRKYQVEKLNQLIDSL